MNNIQITFPNKKTVECPYASNPSSLVEHFGIPAKEIAAVKVNNEIRPLGTSLLVNAKIEPISVDSPEGAMI